jgi:hypothetical protein
MISVDPGLNGCGVAVWDTGGFLVDAKYLKRIISSQPHTYGMAMGLFECVRGYNSAHYTRIVVEKPQIYPHMPVPSDDLLNLHEMSSIFVGMLGRPVEWVRPRAWKGTVKKEIMTNRIIAIMNERADGTNIELPTAKSLQHNVYDACGLGLWALGQLERKRVYPR